jgi:hypothetical protein
VVVVGGRLVVVVGGRLVVVVGGRVVVVGGSVVVVVVGGSVVVVVDFGGGFGDVVAVVEVGGSVVVAIDVVVVSSGTVVVSSGRVVVVLSGKLGGGFPPNWEVSASRPPLLRNTIPPPTTSTTRASWVIKDIPLNERIGPNLRGIVSLTFLCGMKRSRRAAAPLPYLTTGTVHRRYCRHSTPRR